MNDFLRSWSLAVAGAVALVAGATSCTSVNPRTKLMMEQRAAKIAAEPRGDFFIGRRYWVMRTQLWGYLRRPGQSWDKAKMVVMNERVQRQPDHADGATFGFDNNYEYRIWGRYSGDEVYDPNSNLFLPEFVLEQHQLIDPTPGFLFHPMERRSVMALPQVQ